MHCYQRKTAPTLKSIWVRFCRILACKVEPFPLIQKQKKKWNKINPIVLSVFCVWKWNEIPINPAHIDIPMANICRLYTCQGVSYWNEWELWELNEFKISQAWNFNDIFLNADSGGLDICLKSKVLLNPLYSPRFWLNNF